MPASTSPPTSRVLDVIELLACREQVRLADLVRELGLTQGTAHAILKTLCDRSWASRDPVDKTFSLGPALAITATWGDAARPRVHAARAAAMELASELGYAASVTERLGDSLVVIGFEGGANRAMAAEPGDRIPFAAPFGPAFAAWEPDEERRAWIRRSDVTKSALAARLDELLAVTRARGFSVERMGQALAQAAQLVDTLRSDRVSRPVRDIVDELLLEITTLGFLPGRNSGGQAHPVTSLAAPVFDPRGRVALNVAVHPFRALSAKRIDTIGRRLTRATTAISG
jgi:DNA-binding IclR family transcriptional regulator